MPAKQVAEALPAATIMLLRDTKQGMEVFMVVRHHQIDFASGALVFPGGKCDPQDFDDNLLPYIRGAHNNKNMRAIQVSAIREAFEECGILLARPMGEEHLVDGQRLAALQNCREPINKGEQPWLDFLKREQLQLACDLLTHFSHWITPENLPKRFDTHFYLAVAPGDQVALHDGYESVDSVWITPQQAVADAKTGKHTVIFPTLRNIEKLAASTTSQAAIKAAHESDIIPVMPWIEQRADGGYVCIPPEAGYVISEEKIPDSPKR